MKKSTKAKRVPTATITREQLSHQVTEVDFVEDGDRVIMAVDAQNEDNFGIDSELENEFIQNLGTEKGKRTTNEADDAEDTEDKFMPSTAYDRDVTEVTRNA